MFKKSTGVRPPPTDQPTPPTTDQPTDTKSPQDTRNTKSQDHHQKPSQAEQTRKKHNKKYFLKSVKKCKKVVDNKKHKFYNKIDFKIKGG